jgi:hypothetical protein
VDGASGTIEAGEGPPEETGLGSLVERASPVAGDGERVELAHPARRIAVRKIATSRLSRKVSFGFGDAPSHSMLRARGAGHHRRGDIAGIYPGTSSRSIGSTPGRRTSRWRSRKDGSARA